MNENGDIEIDRRLPEGVEIEFAEIHPLDIGRDNGAGFSALRLRRPQSQLLSSSENSISLRLLLSKKSRLRANAQFAQVA
jgi:hypothetical protein